jgi:hypothetical protein
MAEKIIFEIELNAAKAAKRAQDLQSKLAGLIQQREQLTRQRRELSKSLKESLSAEREAIETKEKLKKEVEKLKLAQGDNSSEVAILTAKIASLSDEQRKAREEANKTSSELATTENALKAVRKEISQTQKEISVYPETLADQRLELSRLKKEYANFRVGIDGTENDLDELAKSIRALNDDISEQEQKVGVFSRNVGNYTNSIKQAFTEMGGPVGQFVGQLEGLGETFKSLRGLGPGALAVAGVAGVVAATAKITEYGLELDKTRQKIKQLSGEGGEALIELTAKNTSIAKTFSQDVEEISIATNSFFREFEGNGLENQAEAADLIRQSFAARGNATGELLQTLKEYPSQLNQIGFSAKEAIAFITQQPETGVFTDKGIDAIKEAQISLREFTPATEEALNAIGLNATEVQRQIEQGEITTFEAIQKVSGRLGELPPQSKEVGKAIADIFKGPGEDAGLRYLTTLKDVNLNLDSVIEKQGESASSQIRISEATERINKQFLTLFEGSNSVFQNLKAGALEFVAGGLEAIISGVVSLINYFIDLYNESQVFRGALEGLKAIGKTVLTGLKLQFQSFFDVFRDGGRIISAVFKGEFSSIPDIIKEGAERRKEAAKQAANDISETWKEALSNTTGREKIELISLSSSQVEETENQYKNAGERASKAFSLGLSTSSSNEGEEIEVKRKVNILSDVSEGVKVSSFSQVEKIGIDLEEFAKRNNERLKLDKEFSEQRLEQNILALQKEQEELSLISDENDLEKIQREKELSELIREQRKQALELQLEDLKEGSAEALEIELELIALKKEAKDEEFEADKARIEEAKRLEEERKELTKIGLKGVIDSTEGIIKAFGEQSAAGKAAIAIQKAATAAQIGINLKEQISNAITTGAKIASTIPPPAGPILGAAYQAANIASYTIQAGQLIAELARFEKGGLTSSGESITVNEKAELKNLTYDGKRVETVSSFQNGGDIKSPKLGLIGEKGPEYVVPNKVLKSPEGSEYVSRLETLRKNMIQGFQFGGFTDYKSSNSLFSSDSFANAISEKVVLVEENLFKYEINDSNKERVSVYESLKDSVSETFKTLEKVAENTSISDEKRGEAFSEIERFTSFLSRQEEGIRDSRLQEIKYFETLSSSSEQREGPGEVGREVSSRETLSSSSEQREGPGEVSREVSSRETLSSSSEQREGPGEVSREVSSRETLSSSSEQREGPGEVSREVSSRETLSSSSEQREGPGEVSREVSSRETLSSSSEQREGPGEVGREVSSRETLSSSSEQREGPGEVSREVSSRETLSSSSEQREGPGEVSREVSSRETLSSSSEQREGPGEVSREVSSRETLSSSSEQREGPGEVSREVSSRETLSSSSEQREGPGEVSREVSSRETLSSSSEQREGPGEVSREVSSRETLSSSSEQREGPGEVGREVSSRETLSSSSEQREGPGEVSREVSSRETLSSSSEQREGPGEVSREVSSRETLSSSSEQREGPGEVSREVSSRETLSSSSEQRETFFYLDSLLKAKEEIDSIQKETLSNFSFSQNVPQLQSLIEKSFSFSSVPNSPPLRESFSVFNQPPQIQNPERTEINYEKFAEALKALPPGVVLVEDIREGIERAIDVEETAFL